MIIFDCSNLACEGRPSLPVAVPFPQGLYLPGVGTWGPLIGDTASCTPDGIRVPNPL
jgi:hypothetical protein